MSSTTRRPAHEWRSGAFLRRPGGSFAPTAMSIPPPTKRRRWHAAVILAIALGGTLGLVVAHGLLVHLGGSNEVAAKALLMGPPSSGMSHGQAAAFVDPIESEDEPPAPFDVGVASFILSRAAKRAALLCELRGGPGEADLAVTFDPDGTISKLTVLEDWSDTTPGRCLAAELKAAKIVPFEGEATELRFTLQLF